MLIASNKKELKWQNNMLQRAFEMLPANVSVIDANYNLIFTNRRTNKRADDDPTLEGEKCFKSCLYIKRPEDCFAKKVYASGDPVLGHQVQIKDDKWVEIDCLPIKDEFGKVMMVVEYISDVTHYEKRMERWQLALRGNKDGIWDWNIPTGEMFFSDQWQEMLGYQPGEVEGLLKGFSKLVHPSDIGLVMKRLNDHMAKKTDRFSMDYRMLCADGKYKWVEGRAQAVWDKDGNALRMTGTQSDIMERKSSELETMRQTLHDDLTGLYNRTYFDDSLVRLDTQRMLPLSIIMGDVDGLQVINDIFGRMVADQLVCKIADILRKSCRKEDIITSWGGEQFALLLPNTSENTAYAICRRIQDTCQEYEKEVIRPSISMGLVTKVSLKHSIHDLLMEAEDELHKQQLAETRTSHNMVLEALERNLFEESHESEEHARRLSLLEYPFGKLLRLSGSDHDALLQLCRFHDVGKIAINNQILTKNGLLTMKEWEQMKTHPDIGRRIAKASPKLKHLAELIYTHHERWDGNGYPNGLRGKKIPRLTRMLAIMDAYDVMTNERTYKKTMTHTEALEELKLKAGTQFDPDMVKIFLRIDWSNLKL